MPHRLQRLPEQENIYDRYTFVETLKLILKLSFRWEKKIMENLYQVFIASSLRLHEHRDAVKRAIDEINKTEDARRVHVRFQGFMYESRPEILQKLERTDAQAPADRALRQSLVFFLIIDDVVRSLTQYEFEMALHRFLHHQLPQYIFIFYKEDTAKQNTSDGISYEQLIRDNNLNDYMFNFQGEVVAHKKVYSIPFKEISDGVDSLSKRAETVLQGLLTSVALPYPGAQLGIQLEQWQFFGNDVLRLASSPKVYYRRSIDDRLDQALQNNKVVVLTGSSLAGKTRAVMEALKNVNDGWVYVFNKTNRLDEEELKQIAGEFNKMRKYLKRDEAPKLYIYIDDIGIFLSNNGSENVVGALESLTNAILASESRGVLIATSTDRDVDIPGIDRGMSDVEVIKIPELSNVDFNMAMQYFRSCGITIDPSCFRYKMMGALFVNLNTVKQRYRDFLSGSDLPRRMKQEEKEEFCLVRTFLLKAVKAQSLWRDDSIGDIRLTCSMTRHFVKNEYDFDDDTIDNLFDNAVDVLCREGKMGVLKTDDSKMNFQEYVYRYFLDFDGSVFKEDDDPSPSFEKEQKNAQEILYFCSSDDFTDHELYTYQVSRLTSRCTQKEEMARWLYHEWKTIAAKEATIETEEPERLMHHYSHIIENYIYHCCDFEQALQAFHECVPQMRTDHLLCALMRKATSEEQKKRIRHLPDYERLSSGAYVINAEVEWSQNYAQAAAAFQHYVSDEQPAQTALRLLRPHEIQYDIVQRRKALNSLFYRVSNEEEFRAATDVMRHGFTMYVKDRMVLERIRDNQLIVTPARLTLVDLLSKLNNQTLRTCLSRVFGEDLDSGRDILNDLTGSVTATLDGGFTSETEMRLLICRVGCWLILAAAENGHSYDEVYSRLFTALKVPHPKRENTDLIFCNSFTYTDLMECRDCDIVKAVNLFENDLVRHAEDADNPLYINLYTLNVLLKKCEKENSTFLMRVNQLYNQLGLRRDTFSYYNLLRGGKDSKMTLDDCTAIVRQMKLEKVEHNVFTMTALMACKEVDLSMALSFVKTSAGLLGDFHVKAFPDLEINDDMKQTLADYDEAWGRVFSKPCKTAQQKKVFSSLLDYLEREKDVQLFESGKIYNALLANDDFLPDCEAAIGFLEQKMSNRGFVPDNYSICHLVEKVDGKKDDLRLPALRKLNEFLLRHPQYIDGIVANKRLHLYSRYDEQLPQVFVDANGNTTEENKSVASYVEAMRDARLPVDYYVVKTMTSKSIRGERENTLKKLIGVLIFQQQHGYYPADGKDYDGRDNEIIRERCSAFISSYPQLRLKPVSALSHNKNISRAFSNGIIDINTALSLLNQENESSAVTEFCNLLSTYIDSFKKKDSGLFAGVMGYYNNYFGASSRLTPTSFTFGVLSKAISGIDDFVTIIRLFLDQKSHNPRLTLQPIMLARLSAVVRDSDPLKVLKEQTRAYMNAGGVGDAVTADHYLYRIAHYMGKKPGSKELLADVFRYIIAGGDARQVLYLGEREYLLMNFYESPVNVSVDTLVTLVTHNNLTAQPMTADEIIDGITNKYSRHIPQLINKLAEKDAASKGEYISKLFDKLIPLSRPHLSDDALKYLAGRIPKFNIVAYNAFLRKLYTVDCRCIEAVVPTLIMCIHRFKSDKVVDKKKLDAIRRTEAQMVTYADLNRLHCGHLLIEKAPSDYVEWCRSALEGDKVSTLLATVADLNDDFGSMKNRIQFSVRNLDDAFACSLMTMRKHGVTQDTVDRNAKKLITELQKEFVKKLNKSDVDVRHMLQQPLLWLRAGWTPSEALLLALVKGYSDKSGENDIVAERAEKMVKSLADSLRFAHKKESEQAFVRYNVIGSLHEGIKKGCYVETQKLAATLYVPLLRVIAASEKVHFPLQGEFFKDYERIERAYFQSLEGESAPPYRPYYLPDLWHKAHFIPSPKLALKIIAYYIRVANRERKAANYDPKATCYRNRIKMAVLASSKNRSKTTLIFFNALGICGDDCRRFVKIETLELQKLFGIER